MTLPHKLASNKLFPLMNVILNSSHLLASRTLAINHCKGTSHPPPPHGFIPGTTGSASPEEGEGNRKDEAPPDTWGRRCHYAKVTSSDGNDGEQLARLPNL